VARSNFQGIVIKVEDRDNPQRILKNHKILYTPFHIISILRKDVFHMTIYEEMKKEREYYDKLSMTVGVFKPIIVDGKSTGYSVSSTGKIMHNSTKTIKNFTNQTGRYKILTLYINGKKRDFSVHRLVAMNFCEIPERHKKNGLTFDDLVPNHIDGIKTHNAAFNLEWVTIGENNSHAWKSGLCNNVIGEKNHMAKITEKTAIRICDLIMEKKSNKEILDTLKKEGIVTTTKTIQHIRAGECWKHITKKYNFPKLGTAKPNTIPEATIRKICSLLEEKKYTDTAIAKECGAKREYVKGIRNRQIQTKISKDYDF